MNLFFKYAVCGLAGMLAACTDGQDNLSYDGVTFPDNVSADRRQVEMLIRNELVTQPADTRIGNSIALPSENEVTAMDIYVFGSETEHGIYTFQERLTYRAGQEEEVIPGTTPFVLVTNGTDNKLSTARLSLKKGLYVKLYCVANSPQLYTLDQQEKKYVAAQFQPLEMEKVNDQMKIKTPGLPSEKKFLADYTARSLNPMNPEDVLRTPLLMRGNVTGSINLTDFYDNSYINTSAKLVRGVARFDVHNVSKESRLTITGLGMSNGNATTSLFPFEARPAADGSLITYPWRYFPGEESEPINNGAQPGAFYSYAAPSNACLMLQGLFTTLSGEVMPVTYRVPFHSLHDGNGKEVAIQPNHRYTVTVNQADPYEVKLSIVVSDWDEGGNLDDFKPDTEEAGGMTELTTSTVQNINDSYVYDNKTYFWVAMYTNSARDKFKVNLSSNSDITCKMKFGDSDQAVKWLDMKSTKQNAPAGSKWSTDYTYTFSVNQHAVDAQNSEKSFPTVQISFVSAGGTTRVIQVESLTYTLDGKTLQNSSSYNSDTEYWYFDRAEGTWEQAMQACPQEQGWHLLSMNDFRNLFRIDYWNSMALPFGSKPYNDTFNQTNEKTVSNSYLSPFFTGYSYPGYPYVRCNGESDLWNSNYNYYDYNYNYFWSSDSFDANTARSIQLRARTYAYSSCRRKKYYYGSGSDDWYYTYYTSTGTGLDSSYLTYQKIDKSNTRKIRCVKRRPGHLVYPY